MLCKKRPFPCAVRPLVIWLLLVALAPSSALAADNPAVLELFAMDTRISLAAYGAGAANALTAVEALILEEEALWSVTRPTSEIHVLNQANGAQVAVSKSTADLLAFALEMAEATGGAFDPTVYPLVAAWGFTTGSYQVPSSEALMEFLALVNHRAVTLEENTVLLRPGMMLDLGGVAKGWICDQAAALLREAGISSGLLNFGGNVYALGAKPDGSPWRIGIQAPEGTELLGVLRVTDVSVVTSGAYQRFFVAGDGTRYGHIIDPSTGYPADSGAISVTVVGPDSRVCDALSTALFVMGPEAAWDFWRKNGSFELLLLAEDGTLQVSAGLAASFSANERCPAVSRVQVMKR